MDGERVYNRNVPLDVDPKCIFVVQIYYRFFFFFKESFLGCFCLVLGVGLVALLHLA